MKIELELKLIVGSIQFRNIETGYWVISENTQEYRIIDMPDEIKKENLKLAAVVQEVEEVSIYMSGKAVKLIEYKTVTN